MKVLVTGADGQLGCHVISALQKIQWIRLLFVNRDGLDITDSQGVLAYFELCRPDVVINAAAFTAVDDAESLVLEANQINHLGAANLASASARFNAVIIHISTDYVFSGNALQPYIETDLASPINVYGWTKLAGDEAVMHLNPKHIILRTSWLFSEVGRNFYLTLKRLLSEKASINVVNDQFGAPTYVADLVNLILKIISNLNEQGSINWGVYHYSGYPFISWFDFAKLIQASLHPRSGQCEVLGVSTAIYNSVARRPLYTCLNSSKACNEFGVSASNWHAALHSLAINVKE
jgi:dTDP-4-dehydrorhamnose reductase